MPTTDLRQALRRALETGPQEPDASPLASSLRSVVVLGIGSQVRCDDAAGIHVAAALARQPLAGTHAIDGGAAPESCTAEIRRISPSHLIMVDSAHLGEAPGAIRLIDPADIAGTSFGTHGLPLGVLADYLRAEVGCQVTIIGIQPLSVDFGEGLSAPVAAAVAELVAALRDCLAPPSAPFTRP